MLTRKLVFDGKAYKSVKSFSWHHREPVEECLQYAAPEQPTGTVDPNVLNAPPTAE
jgi:hypothetical protein